MPGVGGAGPGAVRSVEHVQQSLRAAAGAGVVFPTRIGRLELNYCHVLRAMVDDRPKSGFQVGLTSGGL